MEDNDWKYMWSITRGNKRGDIYNKAKEAGRWFDATYKVVLIEDDIEGETIEADAVDYCRLIAEDYVLEQPL